MEWLNKHADTAVVLSAIVASVLWMDGRFDQVNRDIATLDKEIHNEIANLDKEVSIIKTIMIMKNVIPTELAKGDHIAKVAE